MFNWLRNLFGGTEPQIADPMKYLICGLGNPGAEYDETRHNIGFKIIDEIAKDKTAKFEDDRHGFIATVKHKGRTLYILKPMTYMNLSGKAVRYWMQKHNITPENLLVVVDDLNLPFGTIRLRTKGKDGGHNGLKDITEKLNSSNYSRMRIGIGSEFGKGRQIDYVLGKWSKEEEKGLSELMEAACAGVYAYSSLGPARAMNVVNTKKKPKPEH